MKKILIIIFVFFISLQVNAATTNTSNWDSATAQKQLNNIAYKIISANNLPTGISVKVSDNEDANAYANINKEIYVYKGLLNKATTEEEMAAVLAHEIGHIVNGHNAKQSILTGIISTITGSLNPSSTKAATSIAITESLSTSKLSRNDEFEADLSAVDLLIKANYTPLALISVLNKICGNYLDVISTHPSGEKRLMNIYDYTNYNYSSWVKKGYNTTSYSNALAIINANLAIRNANPKKIEKYKKQQEKLKQKKLKRAKKMLNSNGWDTSYTVIRLLSTEPASIK